MRRFNIHMCIGIFLIALGVYAIILDQSFYTHREKIIDVGPIQASVNKEEQCNRLPIGFGIASIAAGVLLVAFEMKRRK